MSQNLDILFESNNNAQHDNASPDDPLSPHNPVEIRQIINGNENGSLASTPAKSIHGQYFLQAAATQEQIMKRDEILRPIFGDVGDLYNDFTCAVESAVLIHGRMFLTSKFLCFYSNLFGLEKKIRIPWSHITSITKANTALVIPNAVAVTTQRKEYIFRSFWDRDEAHVFLMNILQMSKRHSTTHSKATPARRNSDTTDINKESVASDSLTTPAKKAEAWGASTDDKQYDLLNARSSTSTATAPPSTNRRHSANARDMQSTSEKSLSATPSVRPVSSRPILSSIFRSKTDNSSLVAVGAPEPSAPTSESADTTAVGPATASNAAATANTNSSGSGGGTAEAKTAAADDELETEDIPASHSEADNSNDINYIEAVTPEQVSTWTSGLEDEVKKNKLAAVIISGNMNVSLLEFCQLFVNNGAPHGLNKFHEFKTDHHLELSDWANNASLGGQCRELKFIKPLKNVPGISESRGCKAQKICRFGSVGIVLYSSTTMEDVPGCTTFTVEDALIVSSTNPNDLACKTVKMEIQYEIKFVKSSMLKYMIQSATDKDMNTWLKSHYAYYEERSNEYRASKDPKPVGQELTASPAAAAPPNLVFGKVISITPAEESGTKPTYRNRLQESLPLVLLVAMLVTTIILSVQWQRANAKIIPLGPSIHSVAESVTEIANRQVRLEHKLDRLISLLAQRQQHLHSSSAMLSPDSIDLVEVNALGEVVATAVTQLVSSN